MKTQIRTDYLRIFFVWLLGIIAMWAWALFNTQVNITPLWSDVLFGLTLASTQYLLLPDIFNKSKTRLWLGWVAFLFTLVMVGTVISGYLNLPDPPALEYVISPLIWLNEQINTALNGGYTPRLALSVSVAYSILSLLVIIFGIILKPAVNSFFVRLQGFTLLVTTRLPWRITRLQRLLHRIAIAFLSTGIILIVISVVHSYFTPPIPYKIVSLPQKTAYVNQLFIFPSGSIIYTVTSNGLYRSSDAGETWLEGQRHRGWRGSRYTISGWTVRRELCTVKPAIACIVHPMQAKRGRRSVAQSWRGSRFPIF
ncbi:MAG: hypothetical protein U0V48_07390 [Anaerolineales bacterium]